MRSIAGRGTGLDTFSASASNYSTSSLELLDQQLERLSC